MAAWSRRREISSDNVQKGERMDKRRLNFRRRVLVGGVFRMVSLVWDGGGITTSRVLLYTIIRRRTPSLSPLQAYTRSPCGIREAIFPYEHFLL